MAAQGSDIPDQPEMFGVYPRTDCPHVMEAAAPVLNFEFSDPCAVDSCGNVGENWVCLTCSKVFCSRYVNGHMAAHNDHEASPAAGAHSVAFSFSDCSFWCYSCDSYIKHPVLDPILDAAHLSKFGMPRPRYGAPGGPEHDVGVPEDTTEHFDPEEAVGEAARTVAGIISGSAHCVVYTGAGVSTSAKIPDYRGPDGIWTCRALGKTVKMDLDGLEQAVPTTTHMALRALADRGMVKHVVSTNVDGLHVRSGLAGHQLSELHGNVYQEVCRDCGAEFHRAYDVTRSVANEPKGRDHETGRSCETAGCDGLLRDNIIHFGEDLPRRELEKAMLNAEGSDVALVLGTSMRVSPAADLPFVGRRKQVIIVNLQETPKDDRADVRVFARCDDFITRLMQELKLDVPGPPNVASGGTELRHSVG